MALYKCCYYYYYYYLRYIKAARWYFCTDDVFSFRRFSPLFLRLFLQLLYCLDVCIVNGQLALLH